MKQIRGFSLVELMIVIAIVAVGITLAVPSFRDLIERKSVSGAAEAAYELLQRARSQALKRSKAILVDFNVNGTDWAIGFTDKDDCDAESDTGSRACTVDFNNDGVALDAFIMRIKGVDYKNITMSKVGLGFEKPANLTGDCNTAVYPDPTEKTCFDFRRGLAKNGEYEFASANYKLRVQVTEMGHVNVCVPSDDPDAKKIVGYNGCSAD